MRFLAVIGLGVGSCVQLFILSFSAAVWRVESVGMCYLLLWWAILLNLGGVWLVMLVLLTIILRLALHIDHLRLILEVLTTCLCSFELDIISVNPCRFGAFLSHVCTVGSRRQSKIRRQWMVRHFQCGYRHSTLLNAGRWLLDVHTAYLRLMSGILSLLMLA